MGRGRLGLMGLEQAAGEAVVVGVGARAQRPRPGRQVLGALLEAMLRVQVLRLVLLAVRAA